MSTSSSLPPRFNEFHNESKAHVEAQPNIPKALHDSLIEAEINSRLNGGDTAEMASIDSGEKLLEVPDGYQGDDLLHFLWGSMMDAGGKSIQFSFASGDGELTVIYFDQHAGYIATADVSLSGENVSIGDWNVSSMTSETQEPCCISDSQSNHSWIVFSTALEDRCLMLNCKDCGAMGTVADPSSEEWGKAFEAPCKPYLWNEESRVSIRQTGPFYVKEEAASGFIQPSKNPLTMQEFSELKTLETLVIKANLDGQSLPLLVRSFQQEIGREMLGATKLFMSHLWRVVNSGRQFTPAMIGIAIREFIRESSKYGSDTDGN